MVVVTIVGVASALAVAMFNRGPGVGLVATELAGAVGEASRKAVSLGPVDPAVVANEGITERTRIVIDEDGSGFQFYALELRREINATESEWVEIERSYIPDEMEIAGAEAGIARTEAGGTVVAIPGDGFILNCQPTGQCEATTIYMRRIESDEKRRVVIMPLSASPLVLGDW